MTYNQRDLARHALGLPNNKRTSYRNHFCTGPETTDFPYWMQMVESLCAVRIKGNEITGGDDLFKLTRFGAELALLGREQLDPEDFPNGTN